MRAVSAVLTCDGQILLQRRRHAPHAGRLGLLGGLAEGGEDERQALEREVREECGQAPMDLESVGTLLVEHEGQHEVLVSFYRGTVDMPIRASEEGELELVHLEDIEARADLVPDLKLLFRALRLGRLPVRIKARYDEDGNLLDAHSVSS